MTDRGVIIGTVSYMSPEQAEGKKVDARSDIFSFGSVLYEMVTGQRAFQGTSKISTLSAILHQEPKSVSTITPAIPADLEKLIGRCLRKDPVRRFQYMADVKVALDELKEEVESGRAAAVESAAKAASILAVRPYGRKKRWIWAFAAIFAVCLLGVGILWFATLSVGPAPELAQRRLTVNSRENPVSGGCISPDGKYVAYSDAAGIHLKLIETGEERLLRQPPGIAADATWEIAGWFPDGSKLLANLKEAGDRSSVWAVSVIAEDARRLRDRALGYSVSPDGSHIAYVTGGGPVYNQEIWVMDPQGEGAEKIVSGDGNNWLYHVRWSPDSHRLAHGKVRWTQAPPDTSIETCTLKGTESTVIVTDRYISGYCWLPQGYILYVPWEGGHANLWKAQVSLRTGKPEGAPKRLTNWTGFELDGLAASGDGKRITLRKRAELIQVYMGELADGGTRLKSVRTLLPEEAWQLCCSWTADSKEVLYSSDRSGSWAAYRQAIDGGPASLVVSPAPGLFGVLSPDGSWILYLVRSPDRIMRMPIHGGPPELVLRGENLQNPFFVCAPAPAAFCAIGERSPDGKSLTITRFDPLKGRGRILKTIETDPNAEYDWGLSPDGSKLAFLRREEPKGHIRLFSLTGGSDQDITVRGWGRLQNLEHSADGKSFYCGSTLPDGSALLRIDLEGRAQILWRQQGIQATYAAPSPDGRHLAFSAVVNNSNIWMVEGF
jgi:Tol biopolymer transport system component